MLSSRLGITCYLTPEKQKLGQDRNSEQGELVDRFDKYQDKNVKTYESVEKNNPKKNRGYGN